MKRKLRSFSWILVLTGMVIVVSCNLPVSESLSSNEIEPESKYPTVSALLTETELAQAVSEFHELTEEPTRTPTVENRPTQPLSKPEDPLATSPNTAVPGNQASLIPCDLAQAGNPIDISIPDDTRLHPGEYFTKTWQLVNIGSCTWNATYSIVWFSGDSLGLTTLQAFGKEVHPGEIVEISVEMIAPLNPGTYQSNWKLRNHLGELFGIGPEGNAPFWTRIVVVPVDTPTATPTLPLATPTDVILASGILELSLDQPVDFDGGLLEQGENNDLTWTSLPDNLLVLAPENGARISLYGVNIPSLNDCLSSTLSFDPINFDQIQDGSYLCYRTTEGLPGWVMVQQTDFQEKKMAIEFLTWVVP